MNMMYKLSAASAIAILGSLGAAQALELTAAHVNPPGEPSNVAFAKLAEILSESTTGIELTVFPQGQVGGEKDAIEQVQIGALSMTTTANANLSAFAPSAGIYDIPFLFRDADTHPWIVTDGPIGAEIEEKIEAEANVEILGWWSAGMRHVFTRESPVESLDDLKDLKVRVIGSPVYIDTFNALGAKATPMPYGEVYTGLATGAIDGAENDSSGYRNVKFFEQAPYYSLTGHFFLYKPVIANKDALAALSPEQRAEFDAAFAEVTAMQRELFRTNFETDLAWLKENGVTVVEPDRDAFIEAVQPVVDKYSEIYGVDLVQRILDAE
ncbi:TRAP transporter substrate-binding protein [Antarctobacter heliothermus]|uniref:Tripartite ATP-independent transporter solute receptor, DctP family n=1 Tax=Antarctobacter heliothermus TaxID=74033 RepID=A0A239KYL5_9RHOB|nr:TRAP transporter substrate-binding protein [Antarctobacter heliothermus]SNT23301.1 tripartite ATP-independent transporter solute receptor, DctP family [Antarctobacter heliothermus]